MCICMFVIYLYTKFHLPSSNGLLVTAVKLTARENIFTSAILFYILQKIILATLSYFSVVCYRA